ncbi:MAG: hypothetical protein JW952_01860 [Candidatus Eisenbacteria bacterium]|nr:hypothetical protein [Candidatus Eisenbacteria bacterium]
MKQKDRINGSLSIPKALASRRAGRAAALAALSLLVALSFVALAGCSKDLGKLHPNVSPETGVFVEGPLDTVRYAVKLYWWGQDSDGEVIGFYYQWTLDGADPVESGWTFTVAKSQDFILPVPNGYALQTFWVKAVDDKSAEDPSPATQSFPVSNSMPSVAFEDDALPDTTLPAVSFYWRGTDPDGDASVAYYVLWLDGQEGAPVIVAGADTTIGPDYITSYGDRTVYVRAVDDAQGSSEAISHTWHVIQPVGDVLLVDDVPPSVAGAPTTDAFYRAVLDSLLPTHAYTVFDVANQGSFRSPREISLILPLFKQVVWYGDTRSTSSAGLSMGQGGIAEFLDNGGSMFVEGIAVLGDDGSFTSEFATQYLGVDSLRTQYVSPAEPKSTDFALLNGWVLQSNESLGLDSLKVQGILAGCEIAHPSPQAETLYYLLPGTFPGQTEDYYLGTLVRGGAFKTVCVTFPIRRCNGFATAKQEVAKLLTTLGVGQ